MERNMIRIVALGMLTRDTMRHTEVLNVLIGEKAEGAGRGLGTGLCASSLCLVDDDSVGQGSGNKRCAIAELSHASVVVHANPRKGISDGGKNECHVPINSSKSCQRSQF